MKQLSHITSPITSTRVGAVVCLLRLNLLRKLGSLSLLALLMLALPSVASAQSLSSISGGASSAKKLLLEVEGPQNAQVSATPVVRTSPNGNRIVGAYDINVYKDGREWQPAPDHPALVSMTDPAFVDGRMLDIYHEGKNGLEFVATVMPENGTITFPAHSFSVFIIANSGDYARLKVTFHRVGGSTVTVYVKKADVDHGILNTVVFNPGIGTVPSGQQFRGWISNASYTAANAYDGLAIDGVRAAVTTRLTTGVSDGDELHFYPMLFKTYTVSYLDENGVILATAEIPYLASEGTPDKSYTVSAAYTPPENSQKFEGWKVREGGGNISGHTANRLYTNGTAITLRGDVVFYDTVSNGHWLIYHENGKGATYKAADFVNAGAVTVNPTPPLTMTRNGYTFDGWWTGAPAIEGGNPTGSRFNFGNTLNANTHIYAKWNPRTNADYTIIVWKQNVEGDGFDFDTAITLNGTVGDEIAVGSDGTGDGRYATINGQRYRRTEVTGHDYTGFHLDSISRMVTINPEGNAVRNVYYGRNRHTLRFQAQSYIYTATTSNNGTQYGIVDGEYVELTRHGSGNNRYWTYNDGWWSEGPRYNGTRYTRTGPSWQDIKVITALYGQSIGGNFPIVGTNGVTYNNGERWDPQRTAGTNDVIVYMDLMPDYDETYQLNTSDNPTKEMYFYVEALPNESVDYTYGGVGYHQYRLVRANYGWVAEAEDYIELMGYEKNGTSPAFDNGRINTTPARFFYLLRHYPINYMDGSYYDGRDNLLSSVPSGGHLHTVSNIAYRADISSYEDYHPSAPDGYVFEGWYVDKTCTRPYTFDRMKEGGVTVFAKWRQIQYRVFLHPNAGTDLTLDWGSDDQDMNFRVDYGKTISAPTGVREDYEFVGWFTDAACTDPFHSDAIPLNESNTVAYNKSTDFTDPMDKWGNGATSNNDIDRFWITKKYDLYGKWRAKLRGADGITVVFDGNGGTPATATATYQYQDNVSAIANSACTPPNATKEFSHWVLQSYNGSDYEDVPGPHIFARSPFTVLKDDSKVENERWCAPGSESNCVPATPGSTIAPDATHTVYHATYTVKLRAEYLDIEQPTYTFIVWYKNDGTGATVRIDGTGRDNPSLGINVTDPPTPSIPDAPTRDGYVFKGWYKQQTAPGSAVPTTIEQCTPNFLFYNSDNKEYYKEEGFSNLITKVAADTYQPDDYLYAIWEPVVDFNLSAVCRGVQMTLPTTTTDGVTLTGSWTASAGTVSGDSYTPPDSGDAILTFTPNPSSYPSSCASAKDFPVTVYRLGAEIVIE